MLEFYFFPTVDNQDAYGKHIAQTLLINLRPKCGRTPCNWGISQSVVSVGYNGGSAHRARHQQLQLTGHTDGLVQDCSISNANALEIVQSCTKLGYYDCRALIYAGGLH